MGENGIKVKHEDQTNANGSATNLSSDDKEAEVLKFLLFRVNY